MTFEKPLSFLGLPHNIETDIPLLDQDVLYDLEQHAKRVADSLGLMTGHLTNALHYVRENTYPSSTRLFIPVACQ